MRGNHFGVARRIRIARVLHRFEFFNNDQTHFCRI